MIRNAVLRVARPASDLELTSAMYQQAFDLEVLTRFDDHDGFDGVVLGHPGQPYHLEFTSRHGHVIERLPDEDNLIVFYIPHPADWSRLVERATRAGFKRVTSCNPYWDRQGATLEDPDGYRLVLQQGDWGEPTP